MRAAWRRLRAWLFRRQAERDLAAELRFHLERQAEALQGAGLEPEAARLAALRQFGSPALAAERCRDQRRLGWLEDLGKDLRLGGRTLRAAPGFAAVAVLSLALGIGATTATFSVVSAVLVQPLPYAAPDRLVVLADTNPLKGWDHASSSPANFFDWQKQNQVFSGMAAYSGGEERGPGANGSYFLGQPDGLVRLRGAAVTGGLFQVLGVAAMLGRTPRPDETWQGKSDVAVIAYGLWRQAFGGDRGVVGRRIRLNGQAYTVIGVMPPGFYFPNRQVQVWVPWGFRPSEIPSLRRPHFVRVVARLKPGVSAATAQAEMNLIAAGLARRYPDTDAQMGVRVEPMRQWFVAPTRPALLALLAAVGFVLLIVCANLAGLLLARATVRGREFAVRAALGAGRARLARQLCAECLVLAGAGLGLGLWLAWWGARWLGQLGATMIPRLGVIRLDGTVVAFAAGITLAALALCAAAPAWLAARADPGRALQQRNPGASRTRRSRNFLVMAEIGMALILLSGAGLLLRSLARLQAVDPGIRPFGVLSAQVALLDPAYTTDAQAIGFYDRLLPQLRALPGVEAAGFTLALPLDGIRWTSDFTIEHRPAGEYGKEVGHASVSPGYFPMMGTRLLRGRPFRSDDDGHHPLVVIVNEALARRYFAGQDPVGQRLKFSKPQNQGPWRTIIGVVADQKQNGLGQPVRPEIYESYRQDYAGDMAAVLRTGGDPRLLAGALAAAVHRLDAGATTYDVRTVNEIEQASLGGQRFAAWLLLGLAAFAALLAGLGIFGVVAYSVAARGQEIGVRVAVGARAGQILALILRQGLLLALGGVGLGLIGALALSRMLAGFLFGVGPADPATYAAGCGLILMLALAASWLPARRAARTDPMLALRRE